MKKLLKTRELIINLTIFLFVILIFFIFFEIFLRVTLPKPKYERANEFIFYEYDKCLGWKNKPNASGDFYMPDTKSYVKINSKGLRDIEYSYAKSSKRIEFYGDSFTWGYGVDAEKRYTDIFAKKLQEEYPNNFEILNFGTTGYAPDQEYLFLKNEGMKYNPDTIIFAYHNDAFDVSTKIAYGKDKPFFIVENNSLILTNYPIPKTNNILAKKTDLSGGNLIVFIDSKLISLKSYDFVKERLRSFKFVSDFKDKMFLKNMNQTFEVIDRLLIESNNLAKKNNATFIILLIPDKYQVYGTANTLEIEHVLKFSEKENIAVINLLPQLREIGKKQKDLYFLIDGHFSEEGNKIVGELLFNEFKRRGFIKNVQQQAFASGNMGLSESKEEMVAFATDNTVHTCRIVDSLWE